MACQQQSQRAAAGPPSSGRAFVAQPWSCSASRALPSGLALCSSLSSCCGLWMALSCLQICKVYLKMSGMLSPGSITLVDSLYPPAELQVPDAAVVTLTKSPSGTFRYCKQLAGCRQSCCKSERTGNLRCSSELHQHVPACCQSKFAICIVSSVIPAGG